MIRWARGATCWLLGLLAGCGPRPATDLPSTTSADQSAGPATTVSAFQFLDDGERLQPPGTYRNGREAHRYAILESLGGGGALLDYDLNGRLDIFMPGGGEFTAEPGLRGLPHHLWRSGDGLNWRGTADLARCAASAHYSHGCAVGDWNDDGCADLLVTGYGGVQLWTNLGDGTFQEDTRTTNLIDPAWSSSAGWADVNGDGALDLYVAHYVDWSFDHDPPCRGRGPEGRDVCPPREFRGLNDVLFLNTGDGGFRPVDREAGLVPEGKGLGVLLADYDLDGAVDVYVANDTTDNFLYWNDGAGRFTEGGLVAGAAVDDRGQPNGSMGLALGDFEGDRLPDLWVTNFEQETFALYRNLGQRAFQHISRASGVTALGNIYVGFGTISEDFDLDGDEDLAVLNGHIVYHPPNSTEAQPPVLLENLGGARFARVMPGPAGGYFARSHLGRGLAAGDLDRDGRCDLLAVHSNQPVTILRNATATRGRPCRVRLIGRAGNRDAVGARAILKTSSGRTQHRQRYGGGSYLSQSDAELRWGLPAGESFAELEITWPGGLVQVVRDPPVGEAWIIREGASALRRSED